MVLPKTRGIRGRGTLLKKKAKKQLSGGVVAIICALFTIGITLEGLSLSMIGQSPFNILSIISLVGGTTAILGGMKLWSEGKKLQSYRKPKKPITQKFKLRGRIMGRSKNKTRGKSKGRSKSKYKSRHKPKSKSKTKDKDKDKKSKKKPKDKSEKKSNKKPSSKSSKKVDKKNSKNNHKKGDKRSKPKK